ncbi:DUF4091 domain-containing protein [Paenibacillus arenilitoris]|uniref:DUF4091 domain-containing protein n=1 Tax=Paenibacillus arenilitoris TaxID=2772299 RepID=A0A927CIU6_9BACL|nr:DUF4091 domain-containing protein [Paenibacillus arenilitoris]MBD2867882.1 DUF4091 domain-containing protein [Paenibacillus arenilitoris]
MSENDYRLETRCLSSLVKVFADSELDEPAYHQASALRNETFAFQIAYKSDRVMKGIRVHIQSELSEMISVRQAGLVPSELPVHGDHDGVILRQTPGLFPDPLYPVREGAGVTAYPGQWRAIWITVEMSGQVRPGIKEITVSLESESGGKLGEERFLLEVIPALLPEQRLIHTEWFHADCLASYYRVEIFGEEHWRLIDAFVQNAASHGINMMLTPLFTPPLDTAVGGERPTVQLVDVEKDGPHYRFGFDRLKRWTELCNGRGIKYFEFSHLYTQWGAKRAPKIMAEGDGGLQQIFGWDTDAAGEEYRLFLAQFLPELVAFIEKNDLSGRCFFHLSDEPGLDHLEAYRSASLFVKPLLGGMPVIDAISDYSFYEQGLIDQPVCASNHLEGFFDHSVQNLWTYYCCVQYKEVANRFFAFPSFRNRIVGMQLYKFDIKGFLHWGYNFWYSQYSLRQLNPYQTTDADAAFPSGDAFLVYPGERGPVESIRLEVFCEALQDLRALELLESLIGRSRVLELLEGDLEEPLTFRTYPRESGWLLEKRMEINRLVKEHLMK